MTEEVKSRQSYIEEQERLKRRNSESYEIFKNTLKEHMAKWQELNRLGTPTKENK